MRKEFGTSDPTFSQLRGFAFALSYTLANLPLGRPVGRGSGRVLTFVGLLFLHAATTLVTLGRTYAHLLLARVGICEVVFASPVRRSLTRSNPDGATGRWPYTTWPLAPA